MKTYDVVFSIRGKNHIVRVEAIHAGQAMKFAWRSSQVETLRREGAIIKCLKVQKILEGDAVV